MPAKLKRVVFSDSPVWSAWLEDKGLIPDLVDSFGTNADRDAIILILWKTVSQGCGSTGAVINSLNIVLIETVQDLNDKVPRQKTCPFAFGIFQGGDSVFPLVR